MENTGNIIEVDKDLFKVAFRALEMRVITGRAWEREIEALEEIEKLNLWKH